MKIFNFSHPLTPTQLRDLREKFFPHHELEEVIIKCHVNFEESLTTQTSELLSQVHDVVYGNELFVVNPPALAAVSAPVMMELGRVYSGRLYVISMRAVTRGIAREFEIWDVFEF